MNKKHFITLLVIMSCLWIMVLLTACDGAKCNHVLTYHEMVEATCTEEGTVEHWSCSVCNKKFSDEQATTQIDDVTIPIKHVYAETPSFDGTYHWYEVTCGHLDQATEKQPHVYDEDGICQVCEFDKNPIKEGGLIYSLYSCGYVIIGRASEREDLIIMPEIYGMPIVRIEDNAFKDSYVMSIVIGKNINYIGESAFENCQYLTIINWGKNLTEIGRSAFKDCEMLANLTLPNSIVKIGDNAFQGCNHLESINIPLGVVTIGRGVFDGCERLTISCAATSKPSGWADGWECQRPVVWGNKKS